MLHTSALTAGFCYNKGGSKERRIRDDSSHFRCMFRGLRVDMRSAGQWKGMTICTVLLVFCEGIGFASGIPFFGWRAIQGSFRKIRTISILAAVEGGDLRDVKGLESCRLAAAVWLFWLRASAMLTA